jgi:hypothetical protein
MEESSHLQEIKPSWTFLVDKTNEIIQQLQFKSKFRKVHNVLSYNHIVDYLQKAHTRRLMVRFDDSEAQQNEP